MGTLLLDGLIVLLINIPFGYWRANVRRFSAQWILAIHVPVALVIGLRFLTHIGFAWYTYVVLLACFMTGQQVGGIIIKKLKKAGEVVTSCIVMDLLHLKFHR